MRGPWGWRLAIAAFAVLFSACTEATGGGWIPSSVDPTAKATFGFVFDETTPTTGTLSGSYHDPQGQVTGGAIVDVAFKGTGVMKPHPPPPDLGDYGCVAGDVAYDSQNPAIPGSGTVFLVVCDFDRFTGPAPIQDFIFVLVDSGPYIGYSNSGTLQGGDITIT